MSRIDLTDRLHALCALARQDWDAFRRVAWGAVGATVLGGGRPHVGVPPGYYRSVEDLIEAIGGDVAHPNVGLYCDCTPNCRGTILGRWTPEGLFWAARADPFTILEAAGFGYRGERAQAPYNKPRRCIVEDRRGARPVALARTWNHISPVLPLAVAAALDTVPRYATRLAKAREAEYREHGWKVVAERMKAARG